eukprot:CAMPEP_0116550760 /NCGR_PEP_ID=MMETSP0397-20121206/5599_1 /TAXON_ID=216820 /ORGANISM="Cyclophora tenuis, Strain ECT3854" /LENGTH=418 /DNA_ID=CAMNT_0004075613 /DNA_START=87 /DNA_END=1343 /DNA_ORIENTATION=+
MNDSRMVPVLSSPRKVAWDREAPQVHALSHVMGCQKDEARTVYRAFQDPLHRHLLHKQNLEHIIPHVQKMLAREVKHEVSGLGGEGNSWTHLKLFDLVQRHIYVASAEALLSPVIARRELIPAFRDMNRYFPVIFAKFPRMFFPKFTAAVDEYVKIVSDPKYVENGSELVKIVEGLEASSPSKIRVNMMMLWGSIANSAPAVFWMLYYVLKDKNGAYESIKREVDRVLGPSPDFSVPLTLDKLDEMVEIKSAFHEACRMQFGAFTIRDLLSDYVLDGKIKEDTGGRPKKFLIEKGTRLMGYSGTQHFDEAIFEDPFEFKWKRFAPNEKGEAPRFKDRNGRPLLNASLAFGTGPHSCPGRKFIWYENTAYIALMVSLFDLRLTEEEKCSATPGIEKETMGLGIYYPERDVSIELRRRVR